MKVLLIQPPIEDFYQTSIRTQPIGLASVAASLQAQGHKVELLDCQTTKRRSIPIPEELSYLGDFYPFNDRSPFKLYSGYYHFGMDWNEIRREIETSDAEIFGISSSFTPYHHEALEIARIVKRWDNRKTVVMGGAHVSCDPEGVLQDPAVDYAILGEGESRFPALLKALESRNRKALREIDGLGYRVDGMMRIHPVEQTIYDLDGLPAPARDLFDWRCYQIRKQKYTMVITSRGCPHQCAYCSTHLHMGNVFRVRSPEKIVQEMAHCHEKYGIRVFDFEDDNLTYDRSRAKELMTRIIARFGERRLELSAMNGVSLASLDGDLLKLMNRAGFDTINISLVTTDPSLKKVLSRPELQHDFDGILKGVERAGLSTVAYAIFGMPGQSLEDMIDTSIYLMRRRVLLGPSIYYPTPRTPLFERCKAEGILPRASRQWRSTAFPIETREFDRLDLVTLFRLSRAINFIKRKMNEGEVEEGLTWEELIRAIRVDRENHAVGKEAGSPTRKDLIPYENTRKKMWAVLLVLLFQERSFFGLTRTRGGEVHLMKIRSSKKVLDAFFEKARRQPIARSRTA